MKKIVYLVCIFTCISVFSQSKITADQALKSNDTKVMAAFVKNNPDDPKTPAVRQKLTALVLGDMPADKRAAVAKPKITAADPNKIQNNSYSSTRTSQPDGQAKNTAALLTHLFSNDPNEKVAYIQIVNKSSCNLQVKISGKKFYNLSIPSNNSNYILVDKGTYTISTMLCDAKYSTSKSINKDTVITLNARVVR